MNVNPVKIANIKDIETKKRYQYHKRIRSDTGNTIINPLEHIYDLRKGGNPSFQKAKTDLSTPIVPNNDQRYSVLDTKLPINLINNMNTIQINKYEFAPSFTHHKNITLDTNSQYRKFKSNMNINKGKKIDISKIKKSEKRKGIEK